ncbi:MAG: MFS transporter [Thermoplasmata archaeon]
MPVPPDPDLRLGAPRPLAAVFLATFFVRFSFGITIAVFIAYISHRSSDYTAAQLGIAGLVSAMAPIGEFSTVLLSGAAADRWGRYPVLFGGMAAAAVLFGVVAATRSVIVLGVANFVFGIASGAILAASLAVVADRSGSDERGLEMGRFDAVNLSGWIAGFAFGFGAIGALANAQLWIVFLLGAGMLLLGIMGSMRLLRDAPLRSSVRTFSLAAVLRNSFRRTVLVVTLPWLVIYALIGAALVFLQPATSGIGIRPLYLAAAIGGAGGLLVLSQPYFGRWADRVGRTRMMTIGATGFILVLGFACLLLAFGPAWPLLLGLGLSALPALAYGPAALAALADLAGAISRATTMAIYSLTISLGMFLGIVASSQLISRFGNAGLYPFFGSIAVVLAVLTAIRWVEAQAATIPVR